MSIALLSSASLLDSSLATGLVASTQQGSSSAAVIISSKASGSTVGDGTSGESPDILTQDMINLLKALAYGDVSGANTELAKFKADLKDQTASVTLNSLAKDVTLLFRELASGNSSGAKAGVTKIKADLQTQDASTASSSAEALSPLDSLATKISDWLSSGAVPNALHELAGYLVTIGQATGSLINTSA